VFVTPMGSQGKYELNGRIWDPSIHNSNFNGIYWRHDVAWEQVMF
jgi:hypothetical protein